MPTSVHDAAVELLLASMSMEADKWDFSAAFFISAPPLWHLTALRARVYYDGPTLVRAALHVRRHGPAHLRYLSIDDIQRLLQNFVKDRYWFIFQEVQLISFTGYARYYDQFGDDPIRDLELIVAQCLRLKVFDAMLADHPDPLADEIAARRPSRKSILDG